MTWLSSSSHELWKCYYGCYQVQYVISFSCAFLPPHNLLYSFTRSIITLTLGSQPRLRQDKGCKSRKCFEIWTHSSSVKKWVPTLPNGFPFWELESLSVLNCLWNYETKHCGLHFVAKLRINRVQVIFDIIWQT
jgi:hypothetical protein